MEERYYIGQGRVYLGDRQDGKWRDMYPVGDCSALRLNIEQETFDHYEYQSGYDRLDLSIPISTKVTVTLALQNTRRENWAIAMQGTRAVAAGGTFTETITVPAVGRAFCLDRKVITALSIAGYQEPRDYIKRLPSGVVFIPSGSTMAGQTVTVSYTVGAAEQIWFMTQMAREYYLYFDGLNIAESSRPVVVELYKVRFQPASLIELINEDVAEIELTGDVLYDSGNNSVEAPYGGFFRITQTQPIGV